MFVNPVHQIGDFGLAVSNTQDEKRLSWIPPIVVDGYGVAVSLANSGGSSSDLTTNVGTPIYCAPEIAQRGSYDLKVV